ncbi:LppX_LprAFG lipoprotein [Nocardia sp. CA-107356]|uniref:LppX_LprAFG lipoprotein n=1 Tax=Nocardia sp. CA-107356 TaxID=3239972 RepID=UPI003D8B0098
MRYRRAALVVAGTALVAGCGDGGLPDADLMLRDAAISTGAVHSAHLVLRAEGAVPGLALRRLEADLSTADGGTATGTAIPVIGSTTRFVASEGKVVGINADGTRTPLPPNLGVGDPAGLIGRDGAIARLIGSLRDAETVAREDFTGVDAFQVRAVVPAEALRALLPAARTDATLTVWLRVRGAHLPLQTTITFPHAAGAQLEVAVSDVSTISPIKTRQGGKS